MQYSRYRYTGFRSGYFPPGVKWLLITNIALFLVYALLAQNREWYEFSHVLWLNPTEVVHGYVWQLFTYLFLHHPRDIFHIIFNMLALWMFGTDLERDWGTRAFLKYYFLCGIGAGICDVVFSLALGLNSVTIGASGAIYGLLLAFGVLYPNRTIFFIIFPLKAKYFVMIVGAIALYSSIFAAGGGISHIAHLGGMLFGYLYLKSSVLRRFSAGAYIRNQYQDWKLARARRKFKVYLKKHGPGDRDRWVQ
jgi:membrane associated rhomboid family serine protease